MQLAIGQGEELLEHNLHGGLSMLFAAGQRPGIAEVERLIASPELASSGAAVTYRPEVEQGWAELLINGLAFDLVGLSPVPPEIPESPRFRFGLDADLSDQPLEAATLVPGPHLDGSTTVLPVVRAMAGLGASLALPLGAKAVRWNPVGAWIEPGYFARVVMDWMAGGPFPALGMTGLTHAEGGTVLSHGLAFFAGHELAVGARRNETPADTAKLAVRLVDYVVRYGAITSTRLIAGVADELMRAAPDDAANLVRIERDVRE